MEKGKEIARWKIVCGAYAGPERRATDILYGEMAPYAPIPRILVADIAETATDLDTYNLVLVGTRQSNPLIAKLVAEEDVPANGYLVRVTHSPFGENLQVVLLVGSTATETIYAACNFLYHFLPTARHDDHFYLRPLFQEPLPAHEFKCAPTHAERGLWTWGHSIYNYESYAENMARIGLNAITIWNDHAPLNLKEAVECFHSYGIKVIFGYSWAWDNEGAPDISSDSALAYWRERAIETYAKQYENAGGDGIYFQSFTETSDDEINGVSIAETVVKWVNNVGEAMLERWPNLKIQFGLHATSVKNRLDAIAKVDPRICITWEDCGTFPYAYHSGEHRFPGAYVPTIPETIAFTDAMVDLRPGAQTGVVLKGQCCLNWLCFEHQKGPFVMGKANAITKRRRMEIAREMLHNCQSWWLQNIGQYRTVLAHLPNAAIYDLVEDSLFDENLWYTVALYALAMWYPNLTDAQLLQEVAQRTDIVMA